MCVCVNVKRKSLLKIREVFMPRIRNSFNDPLDFCESCFPSEDEAGDLYEGIGEGPDGRGDCYCYDDDHPPYEDEDYQCESCSSRLGERDNGW